MSWVSDEGNQTGAKRRGWERGMRDGDGTLL